MFSHAFESFLFIDSVFALFHGSSFVLVLHFYPYFRSFNRNILVGFFPGLYISFPAWLVLILNSRIFCARRMVILGKARLQAVLLLNVVDVLFTLSLLLSCSIRVTLPNEALTAESAK